MQKVEGSSPFIRFVIGSAFAGRFVKARPLVSCEAHDGFAHELGTLPMWPPRVEPAPTEAALTAEPTHATPIGRPENDANTENSPAPALDFHRSCTASASPVWYWRLLPKAPGRRPRGGHETGASFRSGALIALGLSPRP
jgi:hypothetical protein